MKKEAPFKLTGGFLLACGLLLITCFELLRQTLHYPDILRESTSVILARNAQAGASAQWMWYGMTFGSLCMIIGVLLLYYCLAHFRVRYLRLITALGVLAGLFNTLGYLRWVFLVPTLATAYTNPEASVATKEAISVVFNAFHVYFGFSVGEHLGFLFLGLWGLLLAVAVHPASVFPRWMSWAGGVFAVGTMAGILEGVGWAFAAQVVEISASLMILWIVLLGGYLFRLKLPAAAEEKLYRKIGQSTFEAIN